MKQAFLQSDLSDLAKFEQIQTFMNALVKFCKLQILKQSDHRQSKKHRDTIISNKIIMWKAQGLPQ